MKIYRVLLKCVQFVCFGGEVIMKYETICILKSSTFCSFLCFLIRAKNFLFNLSGVSVYALQKFSIIVSQVKVNFTRVTLFFYFIVLVKVNEKLQFSIFPLYTFEKGKYCSSSPSSHLSEYAVLNVFWGAWLKVLKLQLGAQLFKKLFR